MIHSLKKKSSLFWEKVSERVEEGRWILYGNTCIMAVLEKLQIKFEVSMPCPEALPTVQISVQPHCAATVLGF